ncbi:UNVERIFIED_ORG: threonine/homoserine/homoserine lactone efflux protein [Heyndrickxia coagulans]
MAVLAVRDRWSFNCREKSEHMNIFSYIVLGLSLSVPVGPITIEMVKRGIKKGFLHSWFVGLGGMSADVVLMFLIYFGVSTYLTTPVAKLMMWIFGCIILVYLGYESIRDAFREITIPEEKKKGNLLQSFLSGFLIAISNPLNIIFWIGIYGSVLTTILNTVNSGKALLYSSAIFIGIAAWDITVASSVHFGRKFVHQRFLKWLSVIAGIALIGFGIHFGYQAVKSLYLVGIGHE